MLKIKDNVNLKELGFEEYSVIWIKNYLVVDKETRKVMANVDCAIDLLFDLIQAELVEKVVEDDN